MLANHDYYEINIINNTNLPISIIQNHREVSICRAFGQEPTKILARTELQCYVSKRKHRASCEPIKLVPSIDAISIIFYRKDGCIIGKIIESDATSEEIE